MKRFVIATKLLFAIFAIGTFSFLITYVNRPMGHVSAASDQVNCVNTDNGCLQDITNCGENADVKCDANQDCVPSVDNNECNQTVCTDPDVDGCLPGCSPNSDNVCVPDPPAADSGTPQVLAETTTAPTFNGTGK